MKIDNVWKAIFYIYVCLLLFFVVVKPIGLIDRMNSIIDNRSAGNWNYNYFLFQGLSSYLRNITESYAYTNILGNILPFGPLGFLIPIIFKKYRKFVKTISICFISIIGIESFQFVAMLGYFDINDILLNTLGCLVGYCVYGGFRIYLSKHSYFSQDT